MNGTHLNPPNRALATEFAIMVAAGLVAALIGPFGTFALPLGTRLADWLLFALGGYAFFRPVIAAAGALSAQTGLPRWAALGAATALAALPTTLLVAWAMAGMGWQRLTLGELLQLYPKVLLLGAVVTAIQVALRRPVPAAAAAEPAAPLPPSREPALLAQLPPRLGRDLLYLGNEDHYVRAYTSEGDALLLMRLRDAVEDLAGLDGARVHRSWWVARHAVAEVLRRDRAVVLRLVDGRQVPVARAMVPELRARGWLS
ncbi:LytTR family DNA-binding domain-containing protein [Sphingomonas sp. dw_22]|uniref:LytTR family DNA-binding domain-containing protein n=1 Tax=Sphingomonas sp. dw_22 TaxID=2721175 RepID=UPI001BD4E74D|nr:LytTR family DNA-binding domain-containing protein [Sphingomonas sp. dw_22]